MKKWNEKKILRDKIKNNNKTVKNDDDWKWNKTKYIRMGLNFLSFKKHKNQHNEGHNWNKYKLKNIIEFWKVMHKS